MTFPAMHDTAVVYVPNVTDGQYTVVANAALTGRLAVVTITADGGPGRAELASARRWLWGPGYSMPDEAQLLINGERWNVSAGSQAAERGPSGSVVIQRVDVVRATT